MPWFGDSTQPLQVERLSTGALRVTANLARTGIQEYSPSLFDQTRGKLDRKVRIYRPPEVVFDPESMATVSDKPVTIGHPKGMIGDEEGSVDWSKVSKGHAASTPPERVKDGGEEWLRTRVVVSARDAIAALNAKSLNVVSQGYHGSLDWTPGTTPTGEAYDAIVTKIVHNHTALLGAGEARAGDGARLFLDSNTQEETMTPEEIKALIAEGIAAALKAAGIEPKAADAPAADAVQDAATKKASADAAAAAAAAETAKGAAAAAQAIGDSNAAALAVLDAKNETRGMLPADYDYKGKSAAQIKLAAIKAVAPSVALADSASDAEIQGAFTVIAANKTNFFKDAKAPAAVPDYKVAHAQRMREAFDKAGV